MEDSQDQGVKDPSRRDFVKRLGKAATITAAGSATGYGATNFLNWAFGLFTPKAAANPTQIPEPDFYLRPGVATIAAEPPKAPESLSDHDLLNRILSLKPESDEREKAERTYLERSKTLDQVNKGFRAIYNPEVRAALLDKRYELRANKETIKEQVEWAARHNIHPEVMGICLDVYEKAKLIIDEKYLINPGGMAMLIMTETTNFTNIGKGLAIEEIKEERLPKAKGHLFELFKRVSADWDLGYKVKNLPGSVGGAGDQSGGAVGLQFMPSTGLWVYDMMSAHGIKFNPMDLESSVLGAWRLIAENGYQRGSESTIKTALAGWNQAITQIRDVYNAASEYWLNFMSKHEKTFL